VKVCFSFAVSQIGIENGARWIAIGMVSFGRLLRIAAGRKRPKDVTRQQQLSTDSIEKLREDLAQPTLSLKSVRCTRCKPSSQGSVLQ
jgi:hypothetical protein